MSLSTQIDQKLHLRAMQTIFETS